MYTHAIIMYTVGQSGWASEYNAMRLCRHIPCVQWHAQYCRLTNAHRKRREIRLITRVCNSADGKEERSVCMRNHWRASLKCFVERQKRLSSARSPLECRSDNVRRRLPAVCFVSHGRACRPTLTAANVCDRSDDILSVAYGIAVVKFHSHQLSLRLCSTPTICPLLSDFSCSDHTTAILFTCRFDLWFDTRYPPFPA